jgi:hypothetical protein
MANYKEPLLFPAHLDPTLHQDTEKAYIMIALTEVAEAQPSVHPARNLVSKLVDAMSFNA